MNIAVTTTREKDNVLSSKAKIIAEDLNIPYIKRENLSINKTITRENLDYLLVVEKDKLVIKGVDTEIFWHPNMAELKIKSIKEGNKESMIEASEIKSGDSILDCTLGFAGDSIIFASVVGENGTVVGTEINRYLAYITENGLENYTEVSDETRKYMKSIKVINESYEEYLSKQDDNSFDIVYFDPMFKAPNKKSSAINAFRDFTEHEGLTKEIIKEALRVCRRRIVIKERYGLNNLDELGVEKYYGNTRKGSIVYGVIEKNN
ncbi:MAG: class I SAM-dependent methyltransferase [Clostridium sp.]|nr:class I SAM-dependent methyltransferase [Clostridium sp.]